MAHRCPLTQKSFTPSAASGSAHNEKRPDHRDPAFPLFEACRLQSRLLRPRHRRRNYPAPLEVGHAVAIDHSIHRVARNAHQFSRANAVARACLKRLSQRIFRRALDRGVAVNAAPSPDLRCRLIAKTVLSGPGVAAWRGSIRLSLSALRPGGRRAKYNPNRSSSMRSGSHAKAGAHFRAIRRSIGFAALNAI